MTADNLFGDDSVGLAACGRPARILSGTKFGHLEVLKEEARYRSPGGIAYRMFSCRCVCGTTIVRKLESLRAGNVRSCGCKTREAIGDRLRTHGGSRTPEYTTWKSMVRRCHNPKCKEYENYGARGITVCERWRYSYMNFRHDMGERPDKTSIERINNDLGYCPANCKWATKAEQCRNRRGLRFVEVNGQRMILTDAARMLGIHASSLRKRLRRWSADRVVLSGKQPRCDGVIYKLRAEVGPKRAKEIEANRIQTYRATISSRLRRGWSVADALATPTT